MRLDLFDDELATAATATVTGRADSAVLRNLTVRVTLK